MKKFKTMMAMMLALVSMCVAFSSCSSDDGNSTPAAKEIAGTYTGSLDMTVQGNTTTTEAQTLKIEAVDDATVKVTLPEYGSGHMAMPALEIPDVKVTGSDGAYAFAQESYSININGKAYTGALQGTFKGNTLTVNYTVKPGAMPMSIIFKFVSNR